MRHYLCQSARWLCLLPFFAGFLDLAAASGWRGPLPVRGAGDGAASCGGTEEVKVTVAVILASAHHQEVARELKCIAQEVQKLYPKLTGFRLEQITRKALPVGKSEKFILVDDQVATVLVRHGADSNNRVGLTVKAPLQGAIQYTTCCGKFFPIVTRYETKGGERLIIALRVQPCKK